MSQASRLQTICAFLTLFFFLAPSLAHAERNPLPILEIRLGYDAHFHPELAVEGLQIKRGYAPKIRPEPFGYRLELQDAKGETIFSSRFSIPNHFEEPLPPPGEPFGSGPVELSRTHFALTVPWQERATNLILSDPDGHPILAEKVEKLDHSENRAAFHSMDPDLVSERAAAPLDFTFIGEGYSDMNAFHNDVARNIANLRSYEPYHSRNAQFAFHWVDNTQPLGCQYSGRLLTCNASTVNARLNDSGVPYDQVVVLVNNPNYGGSGGGMTVAYNGDLGTQVFVHELGHTLGRLVDEYTSLGNGTLDGKIQRNCYAGAPPAPAWNGLVALGDYALGCLYANWYRSSPSSIMFDITQRYFNRTSQDLLNQEISIYTGPFSDGIGPTSQITAPANGSVVTGIATLQVAATDNLGISWVEWLKDGALYHTVYDPPYSLSWNTAGDSFGNHTWQARAYDVAGNVGASSPVTLTVANNVPPPGVAIVSPSAGLVVKKSINVLVSAGGPLGISAVALYVDGVPLGALSSAPYSFGWNTFSVANGVHTLLAIAYDPTGKSSQTAIQVTVKNTDKVPPKVKITSPTGNQAVSAGSVPVTVRATDNGRVAKVVLMVNNKAVATSTTPPFTLIWNAAAVKPGLYSLRATATDSFKNKGQSVIVKVRRR